MNEQQWLACKDPQAMLNLLRPAGKLSERKERLFGVACCRHIWHLLTDERSRKAVKVAERFVDGLATAKELEIASDAACAVWDKDGLDEPPPYSAAAYNVAIPPGWWGAAPAFIAPYEVVLDTAPDRVLEGTCQCEILRDMFANPFRPVTIDPAWRAWKSRTIPQLAQAIYDECRFEDLPILADALENAGCDDTQLLDHLLGPGSHVRGCWGLDVVLGRA